MPHEPVRSHILVLTPAGFERVLARRAAGEARTETPSWALEPIPKVTYLGPRIGELGRR
jgi:hypothetical protein